jgi:hypothetical protein
MYSPSSGTSSGTSCTESIRGTKLDDAVTTYKIIVDLSSLTRRTKSSCLRDNRPESAQICISFFLSFFLSSRIVPPSRTNLLKDDED